VHGGRVPLTRGCDTLPLHPPGCPVAWKQQRCSRPLCGMSVLRHARDTGRLEVQVMQSNELDATLDVWRAAGPARGRPGDGHRFAAARSMLEAPTGTTYVAVSPHVIGMTLIEPGGHEERRATDDPSCVCKSRWFLYIHRRNERALGPRCCSRSGPGWTIRRRSGSIRCSAWCPQADALLGTLSEQMQYELVFRDR
jgi:hypothetical protein